MADMTTIKGRIQETIYPNGTGAITAESHQALLLEMVDDINAKKADKEEVTFLDEKVTILANETGSSVQNLQDELTELSSETKEDIVRLAIVGTLFKKAYSHTSGWSTLADGINLKKGNEYKFNITSALALTSTMYIYLRASDGTTNIVIATMTEGGNAATLSYIADADKDGCKIMIYCGVAVQGYIDGNVYDKSKVVAAILSEDYIPLTITRDSDGNVTKADIQYRDGEDGSIAITRDSDGNATQIIASYGENSLTITIARNVDGNVASITY